MCTVLLPPGDNPIAVNKYIISFYKEKFAPNPLNNFKISIPNIKMLPVIYTFTSEKHFHS